MGLLSGLFDSTTKVDNRPWKPSVPYITKGLARADNAFKNFRPQAFDGNWIVDRSGRTQKALNLTAQRALQGSPFINKAGNQLTKTFNGAYLGGPDYSGRASSSGYYNPNTQTAGFNRVFNKMDATPNYEGAAKQTGYYDAAQGMKNLDPYFDQARKSIDSQFAGSGRYGSGLHKAALGEEFGQIASDFANQERDRQFGLLNNERDRQAATYNTFGGLAENLATGERDRQFDVFGDERNRQADVFSNERNNMLRGLGFAPGIANQDYTDLNALRMAGNQQDLWKQARLDAQRAKWDFNQNKYGNAVSDYIARLSGSVPAGAGTSSTTNQMSPFNTILGIGSLATGVFDGLGLGASANSGGNNFLWV